MNTLSIDLSRIPPTGLSVELQGKPEQLFLQEDAEFAVVTPLFLVGEVTKIEEQVIFRGKLSAVVEMTCSRCLETFRMPLQLSIQDVLFLPYAAVPGEEEQTESLNAEGELDTYYYPENQIDFSDLIHDQICLAVPLKPLCKEACQGLCPHCGQNLNQGSCECKEDYNDPRFEILKRLQRS